MTKKVFISSTSRDLTAHREAARKAAMNLETFPVMMENFPAMNADAVEACKQKVLESDLFIGIYAYRYGYVPQNESQSITELEFRWATDAHIPTRIFVTQYDEQAWRDELAQLYPDKSASELDALIDQDEEPRQKLAAFKASVGQKRVWAEFTSPESLEAKVTQSLSQEATTLTRRQLRQQTIALVMAALLLIVVAAASFLLVVAPEGEAEPTSLPDGFNVVVAGFATRDGDGNLVESPESDAIVSLIRQELEQLDFLEDHLASDNLDPIGTILEDDPKERTQVAATIAVDWHADVVIYGELESDDLFTEVQPEYYLAGRFAGLDPDILGSDRLGGPVEYFPGADDQLPQMEIRLIVIRQFVAGLSFFVQGGFDAAQSAFEEAISLDKNLDVLYIWAANTAIRLEDPTTALDNFNEALTINPDYNRALAGRGGSLFEIAESIVTDPAPFYDPKMALDDTIGCYDPEADLPDAVQNLMELARICFLNAIKNSGTANDLLAVKARQEIGRVDVWLSLVMGANLWEQADESFLEVIEIYASEEEALKSPLQATAGLAYGRHGFVLVQTGTTSPETALEAAEALEAGIELLESDINRRSFEEQIETYRGLLNDINEWLRTNYPTFVTPTP